MITIHPEILNQQLPQTQCQECGFSGCLPYAEALAENKAAINLCAPGGTTVIQELAQLLNQPIIPPAKTHQNALAWIDEQICIGCTACIRVCPVDAIMGASKHMHTVLADECTGCRLCVASCPVDCIEMHAVDDAYLPRARQLASIQHDERLAAATHAQQRYQRRQERRQRLATTKSHHFTSNPTTQTTSATTVQAASVNTASLIAQAMAKAKEQQNQRVVPANRHHFREQQIKDAQEKALYRRYMRDAQYGDENEKAIAIAWLRQYKAEQNQHHEPT